MEMSGSAMQPTIVPAINTLKASFKLAGGRYFLKL